MASTQPLTRTIPQLSAPARTEPLTRDPHRLEEKPAGLPVAVNAGALPPTPPQHSDDSPSSAQTGAHALSTTMMDSTHAYQSAQARTPVFQTSLPTPDITPPRAATRPGLGRVRDLRSASSVFSSGVESYVTAWEGRGSRASGRTGCGDAVSLSVRDEGLAKSRWHSFVTAREGVETAATEHGTSPRVEAAIDPFAEGVKTTGVDGKVGSRDGTGDWPGARHSSPIEGSRYARGDTAHVSNKPSDASPARSRTADRLSSIPQDPLALSAQQAQDALLHARRITHREPDHHTSTTAPRRRLRIPMQTQHGDSANRYSGVSSAESANDSVYTYVMDTKARRLSGTSAKLNVVQAVVIVPQMPDRTQRRLRHVGKAAVLREQVDLERARVGERKKPELRHAGHLRSAAHVRDSGVAEKVSSRSRDEVGRQGAAYASHPLRHHRKDSIHGRDRASYGEDDSRTTQAGTGSGHATPAEISSSASRPAAYRIGSSVEESRNFGQDPSTVDIRKMRNSARAGPSELAHVASAAAVDAYDQQALESDQEAIDRSTTSHQNDRRQSWATASRFEHLESQTMPPREASEQQASTSRRESLDPSLWDTASVRRPSWNATPFSEKSAWSDRTHVPIEISEATAVSIHPHHNKSVIRIPYQAPWPVPAPPPPPPLAPARTGSSDTPIQERGLHVTESSLSSGTSDLGATSRDGVSSPLRHPRAAPAPPGAIYHLPEIQFIPATPNGEKERERRDSGLDDDEEDDTAPFAMNATPHLDPLHRSSRKQTRRVGFTQSRLSSSRSSRSSSASTSSTSSDDQHLTRSSSLRDRAKARGAAVLNTVLRSSSLSSRSSSVARSSSLTHRGLPRRACLPDSRNGLLRSSSTSAPPTRNVQSSLSRSSSLASARKGIGLHRLASYRRPTGTRPSSLPARAPVRPTNLDPFWRPRGFWEDMHTDDNDDADSLASSSDFETEPGRRAGVHGPRRGSWRGAITRGWSTRRTSRDVSVRRRHEREEHAPRFLVGNSLGIERAGSDVLRHRVLLPSSTSIAAGGGRWRRSSKTDSIAGRGRTWSSRLRERATLRGEWLDAPGLWQWRWRWLEERRRERRRQRIRGSIGARVYHGT